MQGNECVKIILDGPFCSGKTAIFQRLQNDIFNCELFPTTQDNMHYRHFNIDGNIFRANIIDTPGFQKFLDLILRFYNRESHVFAEFIPINDPASLEQSLTCRIPLIQDKLPNTSILLVGTKCDLRKDDPCQSLLPLECGQLLACIVGAVKYVECSAKSGQGVEEVFVEAIRASFHKSYRGITNDDLKRLLKSKIPIGDKWMSVISEYNSTIPPELDPILANQLACLDEHLLNFIPKSNIPSIKDIWLCRNLELDIIFHLNNEFVDIHDIIHQYSKSNSLWWCIDEKSSLEIDYDARNYAGHFIDKNKTLSFRFVKQECSAISQFILLHVPITVKGLVIISCIGTLSLDFLSDINGLEYLIIANTKADFKNLTFPANIICSLRYFVLNKCNIDSKATDVPRAIGDLVNLQVLNITNNNFTRLPVALGNLEKLQTLRFDEDMMVFPPELVLQKSTQDILQYLKAYQEDLVINKEAKLMIVGQEGVGKSTLLKSMKRSIRITKTTPPNKTDGVDISFLQLKNTNCNVYDLAGDVEYLNSHSLFFSPKCLHLVVFDLSQYPVSKELRSSDQFCRLELWLQTIASQDVRSYVIIVGTHADHPILTRGVLGSIRTLLSEILSKYRKPHLDSLKGQCYDNCLLCNSDKFAENTGHLLKTSENPPESNKFSMTIPHILGYYEVSGTSNTNIKNLKTNVQSVIADLQLYTGFHTIPEKWFSIREFLKARLEEDQDLQKQPIMPLSLVHDLADKAFFPSRESVVAMLRFFHSQGDFLWYEDIPKMKDVVILDPQWLSNQFRTVISYRCVDALCGGVLHHSQIPTLWVDMDEENRSKLISLFRGVGLCFSISEMEELFPCKLPVGWPDRQMWPSLPKPNENQSSLLFLFNFVPPLFFTDLIITINKKRDCFASNVQPIYYRFNVVYITKEQGMEICPFHEEEDVTSVTADIHSKNSQQGPTFHRIHFELMPYNNTLKVMIRGPNPCCMVPNVRYLLDEVKSRCCPGIKYQERILCPICELKKVVDPATLKFSDIRVRHCSKSHSIGSLRDILVGKFSSPDVGPPLFEQSALTMGETLDKHNCPKLFVVLPINLEGLSLKDRFVYSFIRDGYAVHLLCECPGEWHFVDSPGFRVGKPKEFFNKYGKRVCKVLRLISALGAPFKIASAVDPHCKAGVAAASAAELARKDLQCLLENYLEKYPHLKPSLGSSNDDLKDLELSRGLKRHELSDFLDINAEGRDFGPLVCTYVDKRNEWLWLCDEHNQKYEIVRR